MKVRYLSLLWVVLVSGGAGVLAQVPTAQQIEALKAMDPAEREALASQLGIDLPDASTAPSAAPRRQGRDVERVPVAAETLEAEDPRTQRLQFGDTVLVGVTVKGDLGVDEATKAAAVSARIRARNPFRVDEAGSIQFPGFASVVVVGLTADEVTQRLSADPSWGAFELSVTRLPIRRREPLRPFGYDLFQRATSTFAPITDVPVPEDYRVGPGDQLNILLFGSQNRSLRLTVDREGQLNFPELGPISVAGKSFESVRAEIEARVSQQLVGVQVSVGLGDTRAIRVFVAGDAQQPGTYTVSGLATITSALYAAGGVKPTGSLRDVQLKRQGAIVRRFDVYDLLLKGDTSADAPLRSGDVIFVPPVGETVTIDGEVRRPAIYELSSRSTIADVVALAGGLTAEADPTRVSVVRLDEDRRRTALDRPLVASGLGRTDRAKNGDVIEVARIRPTLDTGIRVEGHVHRSLTVAWREGLRISELLPSVDELKPNADLAYVVVVRESKADRRRSVESTDLLAAWREPGSSADLVLEPRDRILVFDAEVDRAALIEPLLADLRRQGDPDRPTAVVTVRGAVRHPGQYPLEPGMRVSDLLRAGGALPDSAFIGTAEVARETVKDGRASIDVSLADLSAIRRGDGSFDAELQPLDVVTVKRVAEFGQAKSIVLRGEVGFPGSYVLRPGETLRSVIERAGGFSPFAFPQGAVFTRRELRDREAENIQRLSERLQTDLAATALGAQAAAEAGAAAAQSTQAALGLLRDLKSVKPLGRLVIDLERLAALPAGSEVDIALRDGDELVIPKVRQEVTVLGEVQNGTSHLFRAGLTRDDYLSLSGGLTDRADRAQIYVVRADGSVVAGSRGWWRFGVGSGDIRPGDTIVVPLDADRLPTLPLWQAVTSILYNSAVALAAIRTL